MKVRSLSPVPRTTKLEPRPAAEPEAKLADTGIEDLALLSVEGSSKNSDQALQRSFQFIAEHATKKVASDLVGLPAQTLMFHGSAANFEAVEARPNQRVNGDKVEWSGTAIFAAMDPRVALFYTIDKRSEISAGIDLRGFTPADQVITYSLHGGTSREDALSKAYGDTSNPESCLGYIHLLEKSKFVREPGLGSMEMITRDESANLGRLTINRRAAVDALVSQGSVEISWRPS